MHKAKTIIDKSLVMVDKKFKDVMGPRSRAATIATIELAPADVLQRTKVRAAFAGRNEYTLMFTSGKPIERRFFSTLSGDPYFNRWKIGTIPFGQLVRCSTGTADKIYKNMQPNDIGDAEATEDVTMMADELSLKEDEVIPFPDELNLNLGAEMMHTFGADIMVLIGAGSGQMMKGVVKQGLFVIAVVRSSEQKKLIDNELEKWVKTMNLVSFDDKPKKPDDVLKYLLQIAWFGNLFQ